MARPMSSRMLSFAPQGFGRYPACVSLFEWSLMNDRRREDAPTASNFSVHHEAQLGGSVISPAIRNGQVEDAEGRILGC
jgi:hypothetical protein